MRRDQRLDVFLRFAVEDVGAAVRAAMMLGALRFNDPDTLRFGIVRLGIENRDLADLADHRQAIVEVPLALLFELAKIEQARLVHGVEQRSIFLTHPVKFFIIRHPGVKTERIAELIESSPEFVGQAVLFLGGDLVVLRQANTVAAEVVKQCDTVFLPVDLPGFLPAHDFLRQHVIHHGADQAQQAVAAPEPLVQPCLNDGDVVLMLLQHELHDFQAQGHVPRLI